MCLTQKYLHKYHVKYSFGHISGMLDSPALCLNMPISLLINLTCKIYKISAKSLRTL